MRDRDINLFGKLRSLSHAPPSPRGWATICALLDKAPLPMLTQELLPYLEAQLRAWPAPLRRAPRHWLRLAARGQDLPQLRLITQLTLTPSLHPEDRLGPLLAQMSRLALPALRRLELYGHLSVSELAVLADAPWFPHLTHLDIQSHAHLDAALLPLLDGENAPSLERLALMIPELSQDTLLALLATERSPHLTELGLEPYAPDRLAEALAMHPHTLARLRRLTLSAFSHHPLVAPSSARGFFRAEPLMALLHPAQSAPALQRLDLLCARFEPRQAHALRDHATLAHLDALTLSHCELDNESFRHILGALKPNHIKNLHIEHGQIGGAGMLEALTENAALLPHLRRLDLGLTGATLEDFAALRAPEPWEALTHLRLSNMRFGQHPASVLDTERGDPLFPALHTLILSRNTIEANAFYALSRSDLPALRALTLDANATEPRVFEQLVSALWFDQLEQLTLSDNGFSPAHYERLRRMALPRLRELHLRDPRTWQPTHTLTEAPWFTQLHSFSAGALYIEAPENEELLPPLYQELAR